MSKGLETRHPEKWTAITKAALTIAGPHPYDIIPFTDFGSGKRRDLPPTYRGRGRPPGVGYGGLIFRTRGLREVRDPAYSFFGDLAVGVVAVRPYENFAEETFDETVNPSQIVLPNRRLVLPEEELFIKISHGLPDQGLTPEQVQAAYYGATFPVFYAWMGRGVELRDPEAIIIAQRFAGRQ